MRALAFALVVAAGCHPPGWDKKDDVVDATVVDGAGNPDANDGADAATDAPDACVRSFRLEGHGAAGASLLTGDFVNWAGNTTDGALAMTLGGDTAWTVQRTFAPGTYQYRFIVDGTWMADPNNPNQVPNGLGGFNSLVTCP